MSPWIAVAGLVLGGIGGVTASEFLKGKGAPPLLTDLVLFGLGMTAFIERKSWDFAKVLAGGFAGETFVRGLRVILGEPSIFYYEHKGEDRDEVA